MTKNAISKSISSVEDFLEQTGKVWAGYEHKPFPNSIAAKELSSFIRPESIGTAYSQAATLIEVAADYAFALKSTLTEPAQSIAPWTCVRGCLEATSLSMWLFDTKIDAEERVKRSLAFRYEGLDQQAKLAQATNGMVNPVDIHKRIDQIDEVAQELGFPKVLDRNNKRIGVGQKMPSVTQVVIEMLNKEQNYRLLSGMVHAHPWALQHFGFTQTHSDQMVFEKVKGAYFEKHISLDSINFLCVETIQCVFEALCMNFKLFGWDLKPIAVATKSAIDRIQI